jgi:hypothetical protein
MSRPIRHWLLFGFLITGALCLKGQAIDDAFSRNLKEKYLSFTKSVHYEDIYLHSDRENYIAGEYLWFSASLFNRQNLSPSTENTYAYVELLDPKNQPVSQTRIRLIEGTGSSGLNIPDTLATGEYTLRAYTNWMKNFLPNGCFMKIVTIFNPFSNSVIKRLVPKDLPEKSDKNIIFFPEGGRLLNGFMNKVGVRVFTSGKTKVDFKGFLSDGINDTITPIVIDSTGIGSFEFLPNQGASYRLISEDRKYSFPLPIVSLTGYSVFLKYETNNNLKFTVNYEGATGSGSNYYYVVIRSGGNILYTTRMIFSGKSSELLISENTLSQGINQITVFDAQGFPVCNRLVYKPALSSDKPEIKVAAVSGKREKINLEIIADSTSISKNNLSDISLSVSAKISEDRRPDIDDYLIRGCEYSNARDITDHISLSGMTREKIDDYLLSLTGNWIKWDDILSGKLPEIIYSDENGKQFLSGYYLSKNKTDNEGKLLFLSKPGKVPLFKYAVVTGKENRFEFSILDKEDMNDFIVQPANGDNLSTIVTESPYSQKFPELRCFTDSVNTKIPDEILSMSVNYQVDKIYGISNFDDTINPGNSLTKPSRFYGKPDQELLLSDYISLPEMQEVFFELVPGVQVKMKKTGNSIIIQDPVTKNFSESPPALLVDGVIINDPSIILNLDPELVEKIDVIKEGYQVGDIIFSGIISVITKAGDFSNVTIPDNALRIRKNVNELPRRFKSPDYSNITSKTDRTPDFRNTLFWDPALKPGKNGKVSVEFMSSDYDCDYEVVIEGISGGKPFSIRRILTVR